MADNYGPFNVRIAKYRTSRKVQGKTYGKLYRAYINGDIRGADIDGKVWLIRSQVESFLQSLEGQRKGNSSNNDRSSAPGGRDSNERIAAALEDLAVTCRQLLASKSAEIA